MSENSEMTAQQYISLAALAAVMVGVLAILAWVLRLGFLVNLISRRTRCGYCRRDPPGAAFIRYT